MFLIFLRLGLTCFGGPIAHLAYFRDEFVGRRGWLSDSSYAQLVALCQFLPGPASSQVGMALGFTRCGYAGALSAWLGFTLPSALLMIIAGVGITHYGAVVPDGVVHGLKVVAVAVVAQAVWSMARTLCPDAARLSLMAAATCLVLWMPCALAQLGVIAAGALLGLLLLKPQHEGSDAPLHIGIKRRSGVLWLGAFVALLVGLALLHALSSSSLLAVAAAFYRVGSMVFGGGHVVLPLLQAEVVPDWLSNDVFVAGYGLAQAVPGPLFTFAAYLGAAMDLGTSGWTAGVVCLLAIFAPSFLLVMGALPFWAALRRSRRSQAALQGVNAAVVGLLLAALYQPVWSSAIHAPADFAWALVALVALMAWKIPAWLVVIGSGVLGGLLAAV